jgi:hypothetical protein
MSSEAHHELAHYLIKNSYGAPTLEFDKGELVKATFMVSVPDHVVGRKRPVAESLPTLLHAATVAHRGDHIAYGVEGARARTIVDVAAAVAEALTIRHVFIALERYAATGLRRIQSESPDSLKLMQREFAMATWRDLALQHLARRAGRKVLSMPRNFGVLVAPLEAATGALLHQQLFFLFQHLTYFESYTTERCFSIGNGICDDLVLKTDGAKEYDAAKLALLKSFRANVARRIDAAVVEKRSKTLAASLAAVVAA